MHTITPHFDQQHKRADYMPYMSARLRINQVIICLLIFAAVMKNSLGLKLQECLKHCKLKSIFIFKSLIIHRLSNPGLLGVGDVNGLVSKLCRRELMILVETPKADRFDSSGESPRLR